jgi:chaperone modulatory protein CbpM
MVKHQIVIVADYTQSTSLSLEELCEICQISPAFIQDLINYEIIHPQNNQFGLVELQRIKTALRLYHDLEVNLAGIAVILDLLDKIEDLKAQNAILDRLMR